LQQAQDEFRERTGGGVGGTKWVAPLLSKDFATPVDLRWPEYIQTARGQEWWIPTPAPAPASRCDQRKGDASRASRASRACRYHRAAEVWARLHWLKGVRPRPIWPRLSVEVAEILIHWTRDVESCKLDYRLAYRTPCRKSAHSKLKTVSALCSIG